MPASGRPKRAGAHRLRIVEARARDAGRGLAHAVHADGEVVGAHQARRQRVVGALLQVEPAAREVGMLEQRPGLMPAGHDRAALALRAAPAPRRASTTSCSTMRPPPASVASAPMTKPPLQKSGMCPHQASSGVDAEALGDAARRGGQRGVRVHDRLRLRGRARGEEDRSPGRSARRCASSASRNASSTIAGRSSQRSIARRRRRRARRRGAAPARARVEQQARRPAPASRSSGTISRRRAR